MPKCKRCKRQMKSVKGGKRPVCVKCRRETRKFLKLLDIFCRAGMTAVVLNELSARIPYQSGVVDHFLPPLPESRSKVGHGRTTRRTRV